MREESEASGSTEAVTQARQPDAGKTAEQSAVDCEIGLTGEVQPQPGKGGSGGQDTLEPAANRQKLSHGTTEARATGESAASIVDSRGATTCIPPNDLGIDWKGHVEVNLDKRISPKPQDDEQRPAPHSLPLATEASGKPRNLGHEADQWRARTGMARTLPAPVSPAGASQSALGDRGTRRPRAPSLPIPVDDKGPHWSPRAPHGVPAGPCGPHGVPVGYHRSPWAPHGSPWVPMRSHVVLAGFP